MVFSFVLEKEKKLLLNEVARSAKGSRTFAAYETRFLISFRLAAPCPRSFFPCVCHRIGTVIAFPR